MERQWPTVLATAIAGVVIAALGIYKSKKEALGCDGAEATQWLVLVRHGDELRAEAARGLLGRLRRVRRVALAARWAPPCRASHCEHAM